MIKSPQDLRLGRRFTFQQVNKAKYNMGGLRDNSECPWETQTERWLEPNQLFLEGTKNIFLWTRMSEHPTIQACRTCSVLHKRPGGCNSWVKALPANLTRVWVLQSPEVFCFFNFSISPQHNNMLNRVGGSENSIITESMFSGSWVSVKEERTWLSSQSVELQTITAQEYMCW